jgi:hypothetical protein
VVAGLDRALGDLRHFDRHGLVLLLLFAVLALLAVLGLGRGLGLVLGVLVGGVVTLAAGRERSGDEHRQHQGAEGGRGRGSHGRNPAGRLGDIVSYNTGVVKQVLSSARSLTRASRQGACM